MAESKPEEDHALSACVRFPSLQWFEIPPCSESIRMGRETEGQSVGEHMCQSLRHCFSCWLCVRGKGCNPEKVPDCILGKMSYDCGCEAYISDCVHEKECKHS